MLRPTCGLPLLLVAARRQVLPELIPFRVGRIAAPGKERETQNGKDEKRRYFHVSFGQASWNFKAADQSAFLRL